ncbi:MAG: PHP domain-containing protein [Clostridiales Family XIII bacterium]|jgi:predicted metal-dependent phosphoesterase TrpH|nr:PHP domain-containing protein [Clostridiales Family XIII bacterium]
MALVDLHLHSNNSDGEYTPEKVVRLAAGAGVRVIALTDHDTTAGLAEASVAAQDIQASWAGGVPASAAAQDVQASWAGRGVQASAAAQDIQASWAGQGVPASATVQDVPASQAEPATSEGRPPGFTFIPGIEMTTEHAREQHILGYKINYEDAGLKAFIARLMDMRRARADNILSYLKKRGVPLQYEQTQRLTTSNYIGRPQIAAAMVAAGYAGNIREAFERYLSGEEFRKIPRPKPSAEEAISAIKAAGGAAVLAHPDSLRLDDAELAKSAAELKAQGLAGIECHYGVYTREQTEAYTAIAARLRLVVTGGSDFHGPHVKPGVMIGTGKGGMLDFNDMDIAGKLSAQ